MLLTASIYKKFFGVLALGLALAGCGGGGSDAPVAAPVGPSTLQTTDTLVGAGAIAAVGNTLTVHYTGWLYSNTAANFRGTQFDTSVGKQPFQFKLGAGTVITGFDQGLVGMRVGGTRVLIIPGAMGYGAAGVPGLIPPNSGLVFSVELLAVQ
jgi:FKBP-type peptidyl-prolyl cis-trans isomerase FkpA